MPSKSFRKTVKRTKKVYRPFRSSMFLNRRGYSVGGFPKSTTIKLRYVETITLDPVSGGVAKKNFSANGMYDPNITGTGHQPSNYDTWLSQYDHYTVQKSNISVQFVPHQTSTVTPGILGIIMSDGGTAVSTLGSLDAILEQPYNKRANQLVAGITVSNPLSKVTRTFSASRFFGKTRAVVLGDDAYRGTVTSNPPDQAFFEVYYYSVNGNDPGLITVIVTIEYEAVMSERRITLSS